ncbi:MAG: hypothetical protein LBR00_00960, partial [Clostridiales Family XIII bacterium]|nr:hypothetical protein [Clostridiales Family XIII bacterium]
MNNRDYWGNLFYGMTGKVAVFILIVAMVATVTVPFGASGANKIPAAGDAQAAPQEEQGTQG